MFDTNTHALLLKILDEIIPAGGERRMPSAGVAAVAESVLSATAISSNSAGAATRIVDAVRSRSEGFADLLAEDRVNLLKQVEAENPADFATLVRETYMAYYSRPEIRSQLGVGEHPVHPKGYRVERESDAEMAELTAPVRARGIAYRTSEAGEKNNEK